MPDPITIKQPNSSDADDSFLEAKARFEKWTQEFQQEWHRPHVETAAKMLWSGQPEPMRQKIRQTNPKEAQMMDELMQKNAR